MFGKKKTGPGPERLLRNKLKAYKGLSKASFLSASNLHLLTNQYISLVFREGIVRIAV